MTTITIDGHTIRSIVKWELMRAHSSLLATAHSKNRTARDEALNALADMIGKRLEVYTITREDNGRHTAAHLCARPDYSDWHRDAE